MVMFKCVTMLLSSFFFVIALVGCNTIVVTHTQGRAEDVVDAQPTIDAKLDTKIDPTLTLPSK